VTIRITLVAVADVIAWRVWRGITEPYEELAEGTAFSWAAASYQAGRFIQAHAEGVTS
jgi:hypothetical protein